ncbi:MAG: carboxypeptidase-like regulatory domain-containing protein [Bacteroidales bacterium]|nr:carboxypeptidase-like regulatory domain-containing protein [Bacteroidales bacterium]
MKSLNKNLVGACLITLLFAFTGILTAQPAFVTINGTLQDAGTGEKISYATLSVPGTGIGTVTNAEGEFTLKVNTALDAEYFEISHLSYSTERFNINKSVGTDRIFYLTVRPVQLKEIAVLPKDARGLVEAAMNNIRKNYSEAPNMMTAFYRESIMQRRDYVSISEAVIDIYKAPYAGMPGDQVKIYKGRKSTGYKRSDTLLVQLRGGPQVLMLLDIVKNTNLSIALDNLNNYRFEYATVVSIDDKLNWVINFEPAVYREDPLYYGKLYIAQDSYAITRAEFSLDLSDQAKAAQAFVQKKPAGVVFTPTSTGYLVTYKEQNGKYYLNYVRVDLRFRCDWKRKLFRNHYTILSEAAITDRRGDNFARFAGPEVFRQNMVFVEKVEDFADIDFWGEHNIIEPESTIEEAIRKISKSLKR